MSTFWPSQVIPIPISWASQARNTLPVQASLGKRILDATNHCVAYRRKNVFSKCLSTQAVRAGATGTEVLWHGRFHAGVGASQLLARVGMAPTASSGTDGEIYLTVGGTNTDKLHPAVIAGGDSASNFTDGEIYYTITPNTAYEWSLSAVDYARPLSLNLFELGAIPVDTDNGGTVNQSLSNGSPIMDVTHSDIAAAHWDLWRYNAAHLFSWSRDTATTTETVTSATYTNIFDGSTTGGATTSAPGFYLETTYHDRVNHDVNIVLAAKAYTTNGTGTLQLVDSSNTKLAEITGITTTDQWYTTTATLTAGTALCTIEATATNTIKIDAVSIYEYLA